MTKGNCPSCGKLIDETEYLGLTEKCVSCITIIELVSLENISFSDLDEKSKDTLIKELCSKVYAIDSRLKKGL